MASFNRTESKARRILAIGSMIAAGGSGGGMLASKGSVSPLSSTITGAFILQHSLPLSCEPFTAVFDELGMMILCFGA